MSVRIDGTLGEGGGQILRSSLALSMITGMPVQLDHIRAGRRKPGLMRQHLTGVLAAAEVCDARVSGASLGSRNLRFEPGPVQAGEYHFAVGTAGSTALVLQTVLPALWTASATSLVRVEGGTHAKAAPPFEFLAQSYRRALAALGAVVDLELVRHGFYPAGGGEIRAHVAPATWCPLDLREAGAVHAVRPFAMVSNLPNHVASREIRTLCDGLGLERSAGEVRAVRSPGPGNAAWVELDAEHVTAVFSAVGARGVRAEQVATSVVDQVQRWRDTGAPIGPHLADQLLLPLAIGAGGVFRTGPLTPHSRTNIEVIRRFLDVDIEVTPIHGEIVEVRVIV